MVKTEAIFFILPDEKSQPKIELRSFESAIYQADSK